MVIGVQPRNRLLIPLVMIGVVGVIVYLASRPVYEGEWMRRGVFSALTAIVDWDSSSAQLTVHVVVPLRDSVFQASRLRAAYFTRCVGNDCTPAQHVWGFTADGLSPDIAGWNGAERPDSGIVTLRYGQLPTRAEALQAPTPLLPGECYFTTILIDQRAAKAVFMLTDGVARFAKVHLAPHSRAECVDALEKNESASLRSGLDNGRGDSVRRVH